MLFSKSLRHCNNMQHATEDELTSKMYRVLCVCTNMVQATPPMSTAYINEEEVSSREPTCTTQGAHPIVLLHWSQCVIVAGPSPTSDDGAVVSVTTFLGGGGGGGGGSDHGELAKPAHQKAHEKSLEIKHQSCPMLQLSQNVVAGITRSEDTLNLMPGNALGPATPEGISVVRSCHT